MKNIDRPIRVFQWSNDDASRPSRADLIPPELRHGFCLTSHRSRSVPFENLSSDDELGIFLPTASARISSPNFGNSSSSLFSDRPQFGLWRQRTRLSMSSCSAAALAYATSSKAAFACAGNRGRITAQLIDVVDNAHLWADRYRPGSRRTYVRGTGRTWYPLTIVINHPHRIGLIGSEHQRALRNGEPTTSMPGKIISVASGFA